MRKTSVSAQITRTARRFSTVIAPQLTKIDTIKVLQKHCKLIIQIADLVHLQDAIKEFVLHNNYQFEPVEFYVRSSDIPMKSPSASDSSVILIVQFYADEILLFEGTRRLLSICLNDCNNTTLIDKSPTLSNPFNLNHAAAESSTNVNSDSFGTILAKVHHPISGIKVFEVIESTAIGSNKSSWTITGTMDELNKCIIESKSSIWRHLLTTCGFSFAKEWWSVEHAGMRVGQICPQSSFFSENSISVEWSPEADNELRLLTLCFGIIQMIREAFPALMHIIQSNIKRKLI